MKSLQTRIAVLATISGAAILAVFPAIASSASPYLAIWSDRTKKAGIVPVEW